ncbi:hypothetical protein ES705_02536 [subsurface metagenome]|nr:hypothetical protein [Clostridia bacterium]
MNKKPKGNKDIINEDEIDLREIFRIFIKRKWWFVGTFIVVLVAGLLFIFLYTSEYSSTSMLKVKEDYYLDSVSTYFPVEASKLRIGSLNDVYIELKLSKTLNEVTKALNYDIDKDDLDKAINISIDEEKEILTLTTVYNDAEVVYKINKTLLDVYKREKNSEFNEAYDRLLQKIEAGLIDTQKEIEELSGRAEEYIIGFNVKLLNEIEKLGSDIPFSGSNYTSPEIAGKLNHNLTVYNDLDEINCIITENKELFVNKIEVIENPEVSDVVAETNYGRNVLITIFLAVIVGLLAVFLANYFMSFRMRK